MRESNGVHSPTNSHSKPKVKATDPTGVLIPGIGELQQSLASSSIQNISLPPDRAIPKEVLTRRGCTEARSLGCRAKNEVA